MLLTTIGPIFAVIYLIIDIALTILIARAAKKLKGDFGAYILVGILFSFIPITIALICKIAEKLSEGENVKIDENNVINEKNNDEMVEEEKVEVKEIIMPEIKHNIDKEEQVKKLEKEFEIEQDEAKKRGIAKTLVDFGYLYYKRYL